MLMESFWTEVTGPNLAQGDWLMACPLPVFPSEYALSGKPAGVRVDKADVIVITQSCDLENSKAPLVAMCPIFTISELARFDEQLAKPDTLERIRKGIQPAYLMLASPDDPADNRQALVVDFRAIHSLPVAFLQSHAATLGLRWRLRPPYLEHFSQALARFFMRVGLPSAIPKFK